MYAEVFRGNYSNVFNLLSNVSKKKDDLMDDQKMGREMCDKAKCWWQNLGGGIGVHCKIISTFVNVKKKNDVAGQWCQMA